MRTKEQAQDYRYFPEPDLVPIVVDPAWVESIRQALPELPEARKGRLMKNQGLSAYDAEIITSTRPMADYYDALIAAGVEAKAAANWLMGEVLKHLNACSLDIRNCPVSPANLAEMIALIEKGTISGKIAKSVFESMWTEGKTAGVIIKEQGLVQMSDEGELGGIVEAVIAANPQSVADFKAGKEKAIGFLVGQIMRQTKGRANPELVNRILKEKLAGM